MTGDFLKRCWQRTRAHFAESDYRPPHHMSQPDPAAGGICSQPTGSCSPAWRRCSRSAWSSATFPSRPSARSSRSASSRSIPAFAYYNAKAPHRRDPKSSTCSARPADRLRDRDPGAAVLRGGGRQPADAGRQPAGGRSGARPRLDRLRHVRQRSAVARRLAAVRLHHDQWPIFLTPVVLVRRRPVPAPAGVRLRLHGRA